MRFVQTSSYLGIAVGDRSLIIAEVAVRRERPVVRRTAEFVFPAGATLAEPAAAGAALLSFLRREGFSASRAVVGLPAKWLLAREKEVPPTAPAQAPAIMRLQAEQHFTSQLKDLVFDYAGDVDAKEPRKVLLMAAPRQQLDRVRAMVEAAGLRLTAATSTTLALAAAAGAAGDGLVLAVTPGAVELTSRSHGAPHLLRHLSVDAARSDNINGAAGAGAAPDRAAALSELGSELKRAVSFLPLNGSPGPRPLYLWNGVGLAPDEADALGRQAGVRLTAADSFADFAPASNGADAGAAGHAAAALGAAGPAAALALAGTRRGSLAVDFVHPRLAAKERLRLGRAGGWGVAAAVLVAGAALVLFLDVRRYRAELAELNAELARREPEVKAAEALAANVATAGGWFEARPPFVEAIRDVTLAFPEEDPIWTSSLTVKDDGKGLLAGRAANQALVLSLLDRIKSNRRFRDVKLVDMRDAGGSSRDITFSLTFNYAFAGDAPPSANPPATRGAAAAATPGGTR